MGVSVGVFVSAPVGVAVGVRVGVSVIIVVGECVAVSVGVKVGVIVGVSVMDVWESSLPHNVPHMFAGESAYSCIVQRVPSSTGSTQVAL